MTKKVRMLIFAAAAIFILSILGAFYVLRKPENQTAVIIQDGKELYRFNLPYTQNQVFSIQSPDGSSYNVITIEDGEIYISEADCPDNTCVKTGKLRSANIPIVCLPNKLIIRYCEEGEEN